MSDLKITVYNKLFQRRGWLSAPEKVTVTLGFNVVGSASVTFRADHPRAGDVLAEGARLVIDYDGLPQPLISGPVRSASGEGPEGQSTVTVTVEDDLRLLWRVLGWQVPGSPITNQTAAEYKTYTGNAETILKNAVTDNAVNRLGLPVTVAPNLGRGNTIAGGVKFRMHPLAERLFPAVEQAGLGVRCYQSGLGLVVDVYQPQTYPKILSEASGTVRSWSWAKDGPTATSVVGGGGYEARDRIFASTTDTALQSLYRDVIEVFMDARDAGEEVDDIDRDIKDLREELADAKIDVRKKQAERNKALTELRAMTRTKINAENVKSLADAGTNATFKTKAAKDYTDAVADLTKAETDYNKAQTELDAALQHQATTQDSLDIMVLDTRPMAIDRQRVALQERGSELLLESRPKSGLALELSETPYFRYGTVQVGDRVTIQTGGLTLTDVIRSATITWDRDNGLVVTPGVGERQDDPDTKLAKAIRSLWRGLTNVKVR